MAESKLLNGQVAYISVIILVVVFTIALLGRIIGAQRGPLSTIPGPRLASFTRLWIVKTLASGRSAEIFVDVNKRYGDSVLAKSKPY